MLYTLSLLEVSLWGLTFVTRAGGQTLAINITDTPPRGSSRMVDHSFPSFAIQMSSFPAYAGKLELSKLNFNAVLHFTYCVRKSFESKRVLAELD
jgi:hypothetical protein